MCCFLTSDGASAAYIGEQDYARLEWSGFDEFESINVKAVSEQAPSSAKHDRINKEPVLIDKVGRNQRPAECDAAGDT